jgi:dephospho-CoA kinase
MHVIGLTGGIACGKSTIATLLAQLGAVLIDADKVVHEVQAPGQDVYRAIVSAFGRDVLTSDGRIDRARLGAVVFADPDELRRLEAIVHPAVSAEVERRIEVARADNAPATVVEAVKLIEAGMHRRCDSVWVVTCDPVIQEARLRRRGADAADARARLAAQPDPKPRLAAADVIIDNSGTVDDARRQVESAWRRLVAKQAED